jgi:hypothetical protein
MNVTSPDISVFDFDVEYDFTNVNPFVKLTNKSVGTNLAGCSFIFDCKSSSGVSFHTGTWTVPDRVGAWTSYTIPDPVLQILGHVEWSGSEFRVTGTVRDSLGNVLGSIEKLAFICKPQGNTGKDNYGAGKLDVLVKCGEKKLYVSDLTNYGYRGSEGILISKTVSLQRPPDATGTTPPLETYTNFSTSQFALYYSAPNYQLILESVRLYDLGNGVKLRLKYKQKLYFPVTCNIDLCPLTSEILKLTRHVMSNGCSGEDRERLIMLNALMNAALVAKMQPLCGQDLNCLVEEIKKLGGFTCDCNGHGDGIYDDPSNSGGYTVGSSCVQPNINSANIQ